MIIARKYLANRIFRVDPNPIRSVIRILCLHQSIELDEILERDPIYVPNHHQNPSNLVVDPSNENFRFQELATSEHN